MKGQAVNIDWTVGLGLFVVSIVSGLLLFSNTMSQSSQVPQNREKSFLIQQALEDETFAKGRQAPLVVRTTMNTSNVPVDSEYVFDEDAYPGSGAMDIPSEVNISGERVVTVVSAANTSHSLSYYFRNTTNLSYSNSIDTGSWMNNSKISVKPGSPGLQSLKVEGNEVLNPDAELNGNSFSITEHELYASTLSGDLKLYNNTPELILEDPGEVTFHLKNFDTLYWHSDGSTTSLSGTGTFKDGNTSAFTVASSYGVTFLGDELNATVSKPTSSEVKAVIESGRLRINLHDSGYKAGENRSEMFTEGDLFFGGEEKLEGAWKDEIERLNQLSENSFESQLSLGDFEYDIEFGPWLLQKISDQSGWNQGSFERTSADRKDNSGNLGLGYRNGTGSDSLAGYWRFDRSSGSVKDYSGNGNTGSTVNFDGDERGKQGTFNTSSLQMEGNDKLSIPQSGSLNSTLSTNKLTIAFWIKPEPDTGNWNNIARWTVVNGSGDTHSASIETVKDQNDSIYTRWIAENNQCGRNTNDGGFWARNQDMNILPGKWNLYTVTYNGSTVREYVNGELQETSSSGCDLADLSSSITIRSLPNGQKIDELRIYNRTLSKQEVEDLYKRKGRMNGEWRFDKGWGGTAEDTSVFDNSGDWNSNGPASEKRYVANPFHANADLSVASYMDSNEIAAGTCSQTVNKGSTHTFSSSCYSAGDTVTGDKPFSAHFNQEGSDGPVPDSFAGKEFAYVDCRDLSHVNVIAPHGTASVTVKNSTHTLASATIAKGGHKELNATQTGEFMGSVFVVESNVSVFATYDRSPGDEFMMHPVSDNLWGLIERVGVSKDATQVTAYDSNGNKVADGVYDRYDEITLGQGDNQGGSKSHHVTANQSALGGYRCADGDNGEADIAVPNNRLATEFRLPEPLNGAGERDGDYYLSLTTSGAATCTVYRDSGKVAGEKSTSNSQPYPGFMTFDTHEDFNLTQEGARISCTEPTALQWEPSDYEGEANLYGYEPWPQGKRGKALEFDGKDDYVGLSGVDDVASNNRFTVSAWVYRKGSTARADILNNGKYDVLLYVKGSEEGAVYIHDGSNSHIADGDVVQKNEWHHLTGTYDGSKLKFYMDGELQETKDIGINIRDSGDVTHVSVDGSFAFDGKIDNVKIFNYALPDSEVQQLYESGFNASFTGNYTREVNTGSLQEWNQLELNASVPDSTSGTLDFEAVDADGDVIDSTEFDLEDGAKNYSLNLESSRGYRLVLDGESGNVTRTWTVRDYGVEYGPMLKKGSPLPFSDVVVSDRPSVMLGRYGNYSRIQSRVAIWR